MTEEQWTDDDDAQFAMAALPPDHPVNIARVFFLGVRDENLAPEILEIIVTPESRRSWGDFSSTRDTIRSLAGAGIGSLAHRAHGADDVVYVNVLTGVSSGFTLTQPTPVEGMVFTLVWRPEAGHSGMWQIHQFGEYALPENLPRTSPGVAPEV